MLFLLVFKVLHIASAAVWWGVPMSMPRDIRRTIALGPPHGEALVVRVNRVRIIAMASGLSTIATGLALLFSLGGFEAVPKVIHVSLGLALILLCSEYALEGRIWRRIVASIEDDGPILDVGRHARRMSYVAGFHHGIWVVILVLMVFRHY